MKAKAKGDVHIPGMEEVPVGKETARAFQDPGFPPPNERRPYWEGRLTGFHSKTEVEEFNNGWVEGAKVKRLEEIGNKINMLLSLTAVAGLIMAAVLILFVAHAST